MQANLTEEDRHLLSVFHEAIEQAHGHNIRSVMVFGSKARGEATEKSDLDILVLIEAGDWRVKDEIADVAYELAIGTTVVPSVLVYTVSEWDRLRELGSPFQAAVSDDGMAA